MRCLATPSVNEERSMRKGRERTKNVVRGHSNEQLVQKPREDEDENL